MIPSSSLSIENDVINQQNTSLTYQIKKEQERIKDYIDGLKAVIQTVYKILMTEKNKFEIYDDSFGICLDDLFGKSISYVQAELPVRITEALLNDKRILKVSDFSFSFNNEKGSVLVSFLISTVFGDDYFDLEVNV